MLTSGFYNSKGGDRKYDAEQFGAMFNGLIADGVFAHYKDALKVTAGSGNRELVVKPGRAWFNGTWTEVDDDGHNIYLMGSAVETTYFVYLAVNKLDRKNTIAWYSSIADNDPEKGLYFYLLAQVTVPGGVTKISDSMITDTRGSDLCPYATGIMETVSFEELVKRVCGDNWQDWLGVYEAGITTGVQNAVATSERALDEVKSMKAYAVESEAVSYIWAKFEAVPTGGGGFEWATDSVHMELSDPPMPMCLFKDLSYADLGPGFKPSISLNSPYIADGETAVKAVPAITQSKVWREYPYFWEGGAAFGTEVLRYDNLQRVVVNIGGTATEKYRYRVSRMMHIPVTYEPGAYVGTVSADNATAYPRDGYKDGYYYMRFAAKAEDVSFYYPGLSSKNVRDAIIEVVKLGGSGSGSSMSVVEVEELPSIGVKGTFYVVKKPGDTDASEYLWLDRWEKIGGSESGQNPAGGGLSADAKSALMAVVDNIGYWKNPDPQKLKDDLRNALYNVPVAAISAVYTQTRTVYATDTLDVLRNDLVVTAAYTDGSSAVRTDYTLSGALSAGVSVITVVLDGKTATFEVQVATARIPATGITLSSTALSITAGNSVRLTAAVEPADSTDTVVWTSSEEAVATVAKDGTVTPVSNGFCKIIATAGDARAECAVSVSLPLVGYNYGNPYLNYVDSNPTTLGKTDEELRGKWYNGKFNAWGNALGVAGQNWFLYPFAPGTHYIRYVNRVQAPYLDFYAFANPDIVSNPTMTLGKVGADGSNSGASVTKIVAFDNCELNANDAYGRPSIGKWTTVDGSNTEIEEGFLMLFVLTVPEGEYVFITSPEANNPVRVPGYSDKYPINDWYTIFADDPSGNILQIAREA